MQLLLQAPRHYVTCLVAWFALAACSSTPARCDEPAALVLQNGKIVTVDPQFPAVQALAVQGDRIAAVGTTAEIAKRIGPQTRVIDLEGRLVLPGFIEGHGHFLELGRSQMMVDLSGARTWEEVVSQVAAVAQASAPDIWILGHGWHHSKWTQAPEPAVEGTPVHAALSQQTPNHPVLLMHASGHMMIANARAMQMAGMTPATQAAEGGEILRDAAGNPTGVLRENAMMLVWDAYAAAEAALPPEELQAKQLQAIQLATQECLAHGVTSFHDAGASLSLVDSYKSLAEQGQLKVRLWAMLNAANEELEQHIEQYRMIGIGNHHLTVRAIKRLLDGALGSHGAWLLDPYADLPTSSGMQTLSLDDLQRTAELAMQHDFQLCVHAIGDRANREVLDLYQRTFQAHPQRQNLRWRVEHAQHLHPDDIPRFAQLGIVAAMQTSHAVSDGPFVVARLGETRAQAGAYVWQALLQSGAVVINGSDAPVEPLDPINGFYAAVTRKMSDGQTFFPDQCMTREQALRSYTLDAAFAAFEEEVKGSLTPGKLADLIVLSQDIMTVPPEQILETRVLFTIVGGQVLHEVTPAQSAPPATGAARVRPAYPAAARAWPPRVRKLFGNLSRVLMDARAARRPMSSGTQAHGDGLAKPRPLLRDHNLAPTTAPVATDPPAQDSVADDSIVPGVE